MDKKTEKNIISIIAGCLSAKEDNAIWTTSNTDLQNQCKNLVQKNWIKELQNDAGPGHKCFEITDKGIEECGMQIGPSTPITINEIKLKQILS